MSVAETIRRKLEDGLQPESLEIIDDSAAHIGHAGHDGRGESHFTVRIQARAFEGLSRVARQRLVMDLLREELAGRVHALSIDARSTDA